MEHLNLIRKLAWSFHQTTGLPYEDLFSEASLHYCVALQKYNRKKACVSTHVWTVIKSRLIDYCRKEEKQVLRRASQIEEFNIDSDVFSPPREFSIYEDEHVPLHERLKNIPEDVRRVFEYILENESYFETINPKTVRSIIAKMLRAKGYSYPRIQNTIASAKQCTLNLV